jgi:DNA-binding MurR/RpiR family transcriptional regulator
MRTGFNAFLNQIYDPTAFAAFENMMTSLIRARRYRHYLLSISGAVATSGRVRGVRSRMAR